MIVNIDENMGRLLAKLDAWDLSSETLVIFMTDNGSSRGNRIYNAGMRGSKGSVHEGGTRVPLFMRWPGRIEAGVDVDRLTRHTDIFPTLAALTGAKIPDSVEVDGRSLLPLIKDPDAPWSDRYTFFHKGRWAKKGAPGRWSNGNTDPDKDKHRGFAVRSERWRLVGKDELYDVQADPGQQNNVAGKHPEVVQDMLTAKA